ncbi:MAG TPA: hypothetical protein VLA66_14215, partial [Thermoanaerobaculia bacterium]|nr:hypothetical protein [Thermoanaerobaculia bacterium]
MPERRRLARAVLAVGATYTAFLLCAQFGFLAQLRSELGSDVAALRSALGAMAVLGILGGVLSAWVGARLGEARGVRVGLAALALVAAISPLARGPGQLLATAGALGGALGFLTVSLAGGLARLAPAGRAGTAAAWGTGLAYLISNLPWLFDGSPALRAWAPAGLCLLAAVWSPVPGSGEPGPARPGEPALRFAGAVALFAGLV